MGIDIGVVYTARGLDPNWQSRIQRFVSSYIRHPHGIDHELYVLYKNFANEEDLARARGTLACLLPIELFNHLDSKALAGCTEVRDDVVEPILCHLNSSSEIMHDDWLKKLYDVFSQPGVGLVGCTGSRVANLHVRDTAFLVDREFYFMVADQFDWEEKSRTGPLEFEHGPNGLTIQTMRAGLKVFVVEKDRAIEPNEWPSPTTYQGNLHNVLVHDRGARDYRDL